MLRLDLPTLVVVLVTLSVAIGAPLASISSPRRGTGALWYWALSLLDLACGSVLLVMREIIPEIASIMLGNALIICAIALIGEAAAGLANHFLDRTNRWFFAIITGPVLGLLFLTVDEIWPRIAYMAAVEAYLVGQLAWQLHRVRTTPSERQRPSVFTFEILLWALLAESIVRTAVVLILTPREPFFAQTVLSLAFLFAIILVAVGTCVLIWHEFGIKDDAIRLARTTDIESGLPNRVLFLEQLEARLDGKTSAGNGCVALMRIKPSVKSGSHMDPFEEAHVYQNAGGQIAHFLNPKDMLARFGEDEFAVLFRDQDINQAAEALEMALRNLQIKAVPGDRSRNVMNGRTALIACDSRIGSADEAVKKLKDGLKGATMGSVRILRPQQFA